MIKSIRKVARGIRTVWRSLPYLENRPILLGYLPDKSREGLDVKCVNKRAEGRVYPPVTLRLGYGSSEDEYVQSGRIDVANMRQVLTTHGLQHVMNGPILDFGCGAGRMLFALEGVTDAELFGADISHSTLLGSMKKVQGGFMGYWLTGYLLRHFQTRRSR